MVNAGRNFAGILDKIDSKTKVLALITLIAEALFLGSLATLPKEQILYALMVCTLVLIVSIIGIVLIELKDHGSVDSPQLPLIDDESLNDLLTSAIQTVCRAVGLPETPSSAKLRAFIFRKEENQLICSHYWSPNPVIEEVGKLKFDINVETAQEVAVVRAAINEETCRTPVKPLPKNFKGMTGQVAKDLFFVLATPIYDRDGNIWGAVGLDTGNEIGEELLKTEISDAVMFQLAKHLQRILSIT